MNKQVGVLFVCMGNICRSPTARGAFTRLVKDRGLADRVRIDSAGTIDYHTGEPPDTRAQAAARRHGFDLSTFRARQVRLADYRAFDYVLAMDRENLQYLLRQCPQEFSERVRLLMDFAPHWPEREVPDPYYGGESGFDHVISMVNEGALGLLAHIQKNHFS